MLIIIWRGLEELNFYQVVNSHLLCHWAKSPYMSNALPLVSWDFLLYLLCDFPHRTILSVWGHIAPNESPWLWREDSNLHRELPFIPTLGESFVLLYTPPQHITHSAHMFVLHISRCHRLKFNDIDKSANFIMVHAEGFEPPNLKRSGFTVRSIWPLC